MSSSYRNLWWVIEGELAGMGLPYLDTVRRLNHGGALEEFMDELPFLHRAGIRAVVCLLNLPNDGPIFHSAGFEFRCFPVPDGHGPNLNQVREFTAFVDSCRERKQPVAVFCEAGLGRTGTLLASYLIHQGRTAAQAIARIRSVEPAAIETGRQIQFLQDYERQQSLNEP